MSYTNPTGENRKTAHSDGFSKATARCWDAAFTILPFIIGAYFIAFRRGNVLLFGDEFHSLRMLNLPYSELVQLFDSSGSLLLLSQKLAADWFGPTPDSFRLPSLLAAFGALLYIYPLAKAVVGRVPAALAALAFASNAMLIYYAGFGRSYTITLFFSLMTAHALLLAINTERPVPSRYLYFSMSLGLLPFAHLSALPLATALGSTGACIVFFKRDRAHRLWVILAGLVAAGLTLTLYLPAWDSMWTYTTEHTGQTEDSSFGIRDIAGLLIGNYWIGTLTIFLMPVAAWFHWREHRSDSAILLAAVATPLLYLSIVEPHGMVYAHTRYAISALPFMIMLLAWFTVRAFRFVAVGRLRAPWPGFIGGLVLFGVVFAVGPLGINHKNDGPFANTYVSMMSLPAFDVPWRDTPLIYETIATDTEVTTIIEAPQLMTRSILLYRNYFLQHKKDVLLGLIDLDVIHPIKGPYVDMKDPEAIRMSGAQFLVLHRNPSKEVSEYWETVYNDYWPSMETYTLAAYMHRHRTFWKQPKANLEVESNLRSWLGAPTFESDSILAWRIDRSSSLTTVIE